MQSTRCWHLTTVLVAAFVAACATKGPSRNVDPRAVAAGLACDELAGSPRRPFSDEARGVQKNELRADDLAGYDRETDDLGPDERVGVRYSVAADAGSSVPWLERQIHCYRAARAGTDLRDPLLVADASVRVRSVAGRYLVDVTSRDRRTARQVLQAAGH